jgi:hypothetical protein
MICGPKYIWQLSSKPYVSGAKCALEFRLMGRLKSITEIGEQRVG